MENPAGISDLAADPRLHEAVDQFNQGDWYASHDGLEALWHETLEPDRTVLQGILQIAVAHLHRERGNLRGATVLLGEGLGRLSPAVMGPLVLTWPFCAPTAPVSSKPCNSSDPSTASPPLACGLLTLRGHR